MEIRRAAPDDIEALHRLIESAYRGDSARRGWTHEADLLGGQRTDPQSLGELVADPAQHLLVGIDGDRLVGCICITQRDGDLAYVGLVTVDPLRQSEGLGHRLLAAGEDEARAFGATRAEMTVIAQRTDLIPWYQRRGYALTGESRPFPNRDPRFGLPKRDDLEFLVLQKPL